MVELLSARFVVALQTEIKRHGQRVLRIETGVHRLQLLKRTHDETGGDQDHERDRDLGHDEHAAQTRPAPSDRKSTRLNSSHGYISYAVFCLKKKKKTTTID